MALSGTLEAAVTTDVEFQFIIRNQTSDTVDLRFQSGQTADLIAYEVDSSTEVWRWSDGRMFTQARHTVQIPPGETCHWIYEWPHPPSGHYRVIAALQANHPITAETSITI